MMPLNGAPRSESRPVALITGASRGIGAAVARELARFGYALILAARSEDQLRALAFELDVTGVPVLVVRTDVRVRSELKALAEATLARFGKVDVLLHNAGVLCPGLLVSNLSDIDIDDILSTNLVAPIELTRALLPSMLARRKGFIGFVNSVGGHIALPSAALYSTTKFALRGFATALRREIRASGVHVSVISPGFIATELTAEVRRVFRGLPVHMPSPEYVSRAIVRTIAHPRHEVVAPSYYRIFIWLENNLPGAMNYVARQYMKHIMPRYRQQEVKLEQRAVPPESPAK